MSCVSAYFAVIQNKRAVSFDVDTAAVEALTSRNFTGSDNCQRHSVVHCDRET